MNWYIYGNTKETVVLEKMVKKWNLSINLFKINQRSLLKKADILILGFSNPKKLLRTVFYWKQFHGKGHLILLNSYRLGYGGKIQKILNNKKDSFQVTNLFFSFNNIEGIKAIIIGGYNNNLTHKFRKIFSISNIPILVTTRENAEAIHQVAKARSLIDKALLTELESVYEPYKVDLELTRKMLNLYHPNFNYRDVKNDLLKRDKELLNNSWIISSSIKTLSEDRDWLLKQLKRIKPLIKSKILAIWGYNEAFDLINELPYKKKVFSFKRMQSLHPDTSVVKDLYQVTENADVLIILNNDDRFAGVKLKELEKRLRNKLIIDMVNLFEVQEMKDLNWIYISKGRQSIGLNSINSFKYQKNE